ncbi:MAG: hypothetical protein WBV28_24020 [Terracidiphilus sp.]
MGAVTAVIVTTSMIEELKETETYPAIEFINRRAREFATSGEFVEVSRFARGKHPESLIFIAGLNLCDLGLLRKVLESAPWQSPKDVQILARSGKEEHFSFAPCEFGRPVGVL